jgi:hypothetical protein
MAVWLSGSREWDRPAPTDVVGCAKIPQPDTSIGFGGGNKEIFAARVEKSK